MEDVNTQDPTDTPEGELSPAQNTQNKVRKIALKYSKGEFSYLYWPCTMEIADGERLHMTSKFFGDSPVSIEEIREVIEKIEGFDMEINTSELEWLPVVFDTKNDGVVPVIELTKYPPVIDRIHQALEKFRKDDYQSYRPHITVTEEVWGMIKEKNLTPAQAGLAFMPLELQIKGMVKYKWGADGGPVEEIDGEDVHTKNPTEESMASRVLTGLNRLTGK